jgi:urease accessory protein
MLQETRWSKDPLKGRKRYQAINTSMLIIERDQKELLVCDGAVVDVLYMDWYEVNKTLLTRQTEGGRVVRLYRADAPPLESGEIIYSTSQFAIQIFIKPCTCIVLQTDDLNTIGHFCFDVGNRHLPLFWFEDSLALAYDGQLYPALKAQYGDLVMLDTLTLSPAFALQPLGYTIGR